MLDFNPTVLIITFNVNGLKGVNTITNFQIDKNVRPKYWYNLVISALISSKVNFRTSNLIRDEEVYCMMVKGSIL